MENYITLIHIHYKQSYEQILKPQQKNECFVCILVFKIGLLHKQTCSLDIS